MLLFLAARSLLNAAVRLVLSRRSMLTIRSLLSVPVLALLGLTSGCSDTVDEHTLDVVIDYAGHQYRAAATFPDLEPGCATAPGPLGGCASNSTKGTTSGSPELIGATLQAAGEDSLIYDFVIARDPSDPFTGDRVIYPDGDKHVFARVYPSLFGTQQPCHQTTKCTIIVRPR